VPHGADALGGDLAAKSELGTHTRTQPSHPTHLRFRLCNQRWKPCILHVTACHLCSKNCVHIREGADHHSGENMIRTGICVKIGSVKKNHLSGVAPRNPLSHNEDSATPSRTLTPQLIFGVSSDGRGADNCRICPQESLAQGGRGREAQEQNEDNTRTLIQKRVAGSNNRICCFNGSGFDTSSGSDHIFTWVVVGGLPPSWWAGGQKNSRNARIMFWEGSEKPEIPFGHGRSSGDIRYSCLRNLHTPCVRVHKNSPSISLCAEIRALSWAIFGGAPPSCHLLTSLPRPRASGGHPPPHLPPPEGRGMECLPPSANGVGGIHLAALGDEGGHSLRPLLALQVRRDGPTQESLGD